MIQYTPGAEADLNVAERDAGLEGKVVQHGDGLVRDERREAVRGDPR